MNVVNPEAVEPFCESLASRAAAAPECVAWFRRNLRGHVLRTRSFHRAVPDDAAFAACVAEGLLTSAPDWLAKARDRGDEVVAFDPTLAACADLRDACARALDWMLARDRRLGAESFPKLSVPAALSASDFWHKEQARRRVATLAKRLRLSERAATAMLAANDPAVAELWPDDPGGVEERAACAGGLRAVRLTSPDALEREGALLDHCVATYADRVARGESRIYSLRDGRNLPLVTVEATGPAGKCGYLAPFLPKDFAVLAQASARSNRPVPNELLPALRDLLVNEGIGVPDASRFPGWLRDEVGVTRHVDLPALAAGFRSATASDATPPWRSPGPTANDALRLLVAGADLVPEDGMREVLRAFLPTVDGIAWDRSVVEVPGVRLEKAWVSLPVGAFARSAAAVRDAFPDEVHAACVRLADAVLDAASAAPRSTFAVAFSVQDAFPTEDAFFAYAGRLAEWVAARDSASLAFRTGLGEAAASARRALSRGAALPDVERDRLHNVLNVVIPSLTPRPRAPQRVAAPAAEPPGAATARKVASAAAQARIRRVSSRRTAASSP